MVLKEKNVDCFASDFFPRNKEAQVGLEKRGDYHMVWKKQIGGRGHVSMGGVEATRAKRTNSLLIVEIPSSLI